MESKVIQNEIDIRINELNKLLKNFKKSPNRNYKRITLELKLKEAKNIYNSTIHTLSTYESKFSHTELDFYSKAAREIYNEIIILINNKLYTAFNHKISLFSVTLVVCFVKRLLNISKKMTTLREMILTASQTVPDYDGTGNK